MRRLAKGNEAVVEAAVRAGCRAFFGYPITPASEISESAARLLPAAGGVFLQAESEIAAIQMAYGASAAGVRVLTASSGPGISLMQEGISYLAGSELPCVIVDITRGGPGLGNIGPEQGDYFQVVKGGGHGNYRTIVLAPGSVQEMADLTILAFELADRYTNPVVVLADGVLGQMMEALELPESIGKAPAKDWAVAGTAASRRNLVSSIHLEHAALEAHVTKLAAKYRLVEERECRWDEYRTSDAEVLVVAYGIAGRIARAAVDGARARGVAAGLLRPVTLYPFPAEVLRSLAQRTASVLVLELSTGQLIEDVRLAVEGRCPVGLMSRTGGMLPDVEDVRARIAALEHESVRT
jgi:pyruvate/2-oxoacid:ferredoxin oxidoreductase alpha subunit